MCGLESRDHARRDGGGVSAGERRTGALRSSLVGIVGSQADSVTSRM